MVALNFHPGALISALVFLLLFGWIVWRWSRTSEDPPGILIIKIALSLVLLAAAVWCMVSLHPLIGIPLGAICGIIVGILWGRNVGTWLAAPLSDLYDGGKEKVEPRPFYAIAEAHRKQARYDESIAEIRRQLERFPGDVQGLLMLAEVYARHLHDWESASVTIDQIVANEELAVGTRAKALQALADWQLDLANDGAAARATLGRIAELFPGTPSAVEAATRLAHVSQSGDAWRRERQSASLLRMVTGDPHLGLRGESPSAPAPPDPEIEADELRRQIAAHPLDTEARERLALLYAERLGRFDWAIGEIDKLLGLPHQAPKAMARWLHMLADLHVRGTGDEVAARAALGRVTELFPETALAAAAQSRRDHLKLEMRVRQERRILGVDPTKLGPTSGQGGVPE